MSPTVLRTALLGAVLASPALPQASWAQLAPTASPAPRAGAQGTSDGSRLLLFGGNLGSSVMSQETWSFDGTAWTDLTPTSGPLPTGRDWHAACWDATNQNLVVFGGRDGSNLDLGDTWTFNTVTGQWTQHTTLPAPSPRRWASMDYDPLRQQVVLYGGYDNLGQVFSNETWAWNGGGWSLLTPATDPGPRGRGRMVWYPPTGELMYFGGRSATSGGQLGDTWFFDGNNWRQQVTNTIPGPSNAGVLAGAMTYDAFRERMVFFGGTFSGPTLGTTWEFDGNDWRDRGNRGSIPGRTFPSVAYLASTRTSYLFGGFISAMQGDTWEYRTNAPAAVSLQGAGCGNPGAIPAMASAGLPWLGSSFTLSVSNVGSAPVVLTIGFSDTVWNGIPLPFDLGLVGAAGCTLYNDIETSVSLTPLAGTASLLAAIPSDALLIGARAYAQGLVFAPGANALNFWFSDQLTATVGIR